MEVNNHIITEEVIDILYELKDQLAINGIQRFAKIIESGDNVMTCCPFHKDGQERKPSFGILAKSKRGDDEGTCHCFGCGWAGSFSEMISNCFGYDDFGKYGNKWLIKNFLSVQVERRPDMDLDLSRNDTKIETKYVSEDELDRYRLYHQYMWKRKMTPEVVNIFDIGYDPDTECITFPVRDIEGNCLYVARRSVNTKFFNYPENVEKPVYGIYELAHNSYTDEVIICESMINAITCWVYGKYAVALNGTGTDYQYEQLRALPYRKYILALDPDDAGNHGREKLKKALTNKIVTEYIIPKGKDINDLSESEFNKLKEVF